MKIIPFSVIMKNASNDEIKVLIVYTSKTGATQQYAQWIAEELSSADIFCIDDGYEGSFLEKYDTVVFGSYVKMGKVRLQDFLAANHSLYMHKDVFMYTVGLVPLVTKEGQASWNRVPAFIRDEIIYHEKFSGKISSHNLNFFEKIIVKLIGKNSRGKLERKEINAFVNCVKKHINKKI